MSGWCNLHSNHACFVAYTTYPTPQTRVFCIPLAPVPIKYWVAPVAATRPGTMPPQPPFRCHWRLPSRCSCCVQAPRLLQPPPPLVSTCGEMPSTRWGPLPWTLASRLVASLALPAATLRSTPLQTERSCRHRQQASPTLARPPAVAPSLNSVWAAVGKPHLSLFSQTVRIASRMLCLLGTTIWHACLTHQ